MQNDIKMIDLLNIAVKAGEAILSVYHAGEVEVESKADQSPLTQADKMSHAVIAESLVMRYPGIPVLSEEGNPLPYPKRRGWEDLWVVDPLDGTKEFIKRNGEFTVNIALVHRGCPVLGVIYAPVLDVLYFARSGMGSFKMEKWREEAAAVSSDEQLVKLAVRLPNCNPRTELGAVASRSHLSPETEAYLNRIRAKYGGIGIRSAGSSLKFCLVAEGQADVYPRFAPTMEWDTCAGQAIVEQAGGTVLRADFGEPLAYNKEDLLNPWFIAKSSTSLDF